MNFFYILLLVNIILILGGDYLHKYPKNCKAYVKHLFTAIFIVFVVLTSVSELINKVFYCHFELTYAVEINILLFFHFISDSL